MAFYFPIYSSVVLLYLMLLLALIPFLHNQLDGNWASNYDTPEFSISGSPRAGATALGWRGL